MQLQLNPNKKKRKLKIVREPQKLIEQAIEQEDNERWKVDVLPDMSVTRAVSHFEMSALNAGALRNAAGVHMKAVAVEPEQEKKKLKIVRKPQKLMEQAIEQEGKEVEVGHTHIHGRHPSRVPL